MRKFIINPEAILCMSNVRGNSVKYPHKLPFSFYFSGRTGIKHDIRVKPVFDPERLIVSEAGTLKLSDDWNYIPGPNDRNVSKHQIRMMKEFFKEYIVLFCAVWDLQLQDGLVEDFFRGLVYIHELIQDLSFYNDYKSELDNINTVEELDKFCRDNNLVNFRGN